MTFDETQPALKEDNRPTKPLQPKVYEASFLQFDGDVEHRYYQADRLIEAAEQANSVVEDDPFTALVQVKELGPLNGKEV